MQNTEKNIEIGELGKVSLIADWSVKVLINKGSNIDIKKGQRLLVYGKDRIDVPDSENITVEVVKGIGRVIDKSKDNNTITIVPESVVKNIKLRGAKGAKGARGVIKVKKTASHVALNTNHRGRYMGWAFDTPDVGDYVKIEKGRPSVSWHTSDDKCVKCKIK
jgi:hypothetical protein